MKKVLLKTEGLSKSFSNGGVLQHVLKNIDLELYEGDFTVIMGARSVTMKRIESSTLQNLHL